MPFMELVCATKNKGKAAEIAALLAGEYNILTLDQLGIDEDINEDGMTFEENAIKKAVGFMKLTGKIVLADDSGLEVNALNGAPGVYSARFLGRDTPYSVKNRKLLEMLEGAENRSARFRCVIVVAFPNGHMLRRCAEKNFTHDAAVWQKDKEDVKFISKHCLTVAGILEGEIAHEPTGTDGFGYDPVFYVPEYRMTLAQMNAEQKNKISHRGKAMAEMRKLLTQCFSCGGSNATLLPRKNNDLYFLAK